jgi:hypothetical protein
MKGAAQTVVPYAGLLRNVTRTVDPTIREVHSPLDAAKEIIPGLSSNLAPRLGVFGEPLQRPGNAASRFLAPSLPVAMSGDPLKTALDAMDAPLPNDRRVTSVPLVPGVRAAVPPVLDQQRRQQGGAELRGVLEPLLASPQFRALPAEQQHEIVARLMAQIRGNARANLDAVVKTQAVTNPNLLRGALLQQLQGAR